MVKRALTEEEKTQSLKGVERLEQELEVFDYANQRIKLQLDIGLKITKRDLEKEYCNNQKDIDERKIKIKILKDHVVDGVEVKESIVEEELNIKETKENE